MSTSNDNITEQILSATPIDERQAQRIAPTSDREGDTIAAIGRMCCELDQSAQERIALWVVSKYGA